MHIAETFHLLALPESNFTEGLDSQVVIKAKELMAQTILATDMASHNYLVTQLETRIEVGSLDFTSFKDSDTVSFVLQVTPPPHLLITPSRHRVTISQRWS